MICNIGNIVDKNDVQRKYTQKIVDNNVEDCNLGSDQHPKMVKLCSSLPPYFKQRYVDLLKEFVDVLSSSY